MPDIMKMGANPEFLGSWDIEECPNREVTLTIDKIVDEKVVTNGQPEICTVIYWTDPAYKKMIVNVTNKKRICKLYKTKDTEKMIGKSVIVGTEKVKAFGDVYDALRIRPRIPQVKNAALPKCEQCGKDIESRGNMTSTQVASYTLSKYGKQMCSICATAAAKEAQK